MLYLPISQSWMVSRRARRTYFICALSSLYLLGTAIAIHSAVLSASFSLRSNLPPATVLLIQILVWPGVIGTAILWVAMWYFWFSFDASGYFKKTVWCFLLYFLALFAQAFYYFFVYRRSPLVKSVP
jgi:hypothetical protein